MKRNSSLLTHYLINRWDVAWETVLAHTHRKPNTFAAVSLMVASVFDQENLGTLSSTPLRLPLSENTPLLSRRERQALISRIIRRIQQTPIPLISHYAVSTIERLALLGPVHLWHIPETTTIYHHTLPRQLFADTLPGDQEISGGVRASGLLALQESLGVDRLLIEPMDDSLMSSTLVSLQHQGCRTLFLFDTNKVSLEATELVLSQFSNLPIHLVVISADGGGSHHTELARYSVIHYYHVIERLEEALRFVTTRTLSLRPGIIAPLEGVIFDTTARLHQKKMIVVEEMLKVLYARRVDQSSDSFRVSKPFLAPM